MTKKEIKQELYYYLKYLKLDDKTLKIKNECINKLMDELYIDLSTNLKINKIESFFCKNAKLEEEYAVFYAFSLPCIVFMKNIEFKLDLVITIFKNDDVEYIRCY